MDVAHPIRSVVPTLDGPVLEVLARTSQALSGREVHMLAAVGSPTGVRRVLSRLVDQGLVSADERPAATYYRANRKHLAWPAVEALADLRNRLLNRLRRDVRSWHVPPVHASLFGSTARGDGDVHSDIDVLVIRPAGVNEDDSPWAEQVDRLRARVREWTGNRCQPLQVDLERLTEYVRAGDALVDEWRRDAINIFGDDLHVVLRRVQPLGRRR